MLKIDIGHIAILPFRGLTKKADLFSFEHEPVICHYFDESGNDYIFYWVDFENNAKRWLCIRTSKESLYSYLTGGLMLREIALDRELNSFILLLNQFENEGFKDGYLLENTHLPDEYLPNKDSYYKYLLPTEYADYLHEYTFINKLKEKAFIFHLVPVETMHGQCVVGADVAAFFLDNIVKSGREYIRYNTFNWFKEVVPSQAKLIDLTNRLSKLGTFQMPILRRASFEVGLSIDVASMNTDYRLGFDWQKELIDGYKKDVLDVDYTDIEQAKEIANKYDEDTRNRIFSPFMRILNNPKIKMSVKSYKGGFRKDYSIRGLKKEFRKIVVPRFEDDEDVPVKKLILRKLVVAMEEGKPIKSIKELTDNLLWGEEQTEEFYIMHSPLIFEHNSYPLKKDISCNVTIAPDGGSIQIYHGGLELFATGKNSEEVKNNINVELGKLIVEYLDLLSRNKFREFPKFLELLTFLDLEKMNITP